MLWAVRHFLPTKHGLPSEYNKTTNLPSSPAGRMLENFERSLLWGPQSKSLHRKPTGRTFLPTTETIKPRTVRSKILLSESISGLLKLPRFCLAVKASCNRIKRVPIGPWKKIRMSHYWASNELKKLAVFAAMIRSSPLRIKGPLLTGTHQSPPVG